MIFVSAQPDELLFAWQTEVQLLNFSKLGIDLKTVYVLVGIKQGVRDFPNWDRILNKYKEVNVIFYTDTRVIYYDNDGKQKNYVPSIRPHLLSKFFEMFPNLQEEYMFYYDSDIVLTEIPAFEAMEDGRWHVSKADYISWNYIDEKRSPTLMKDMLSSVGISEDIVKEKGQEVGGVQYFIYGTTPEFWNKVEQDCERMWITHHEHFEIYRNEFFNNKIYPTIKEQYPIDFYTDKLSNWKEGTTEYEKWDFQIWCVDMWCILWNAYLQGADVYVNPELNFTWPSHSEETLLEDKIYHDTGVNANSPMFHKGSYKMKTPFNDDLSKLGYSPEGKRYAQRYYIDLIEEIQKSEQYSEDINPLHLPVVSCLMTTYGRFECVERSIACWLNQDYPNKELVILNTAETHLELSANLQNKGIRIVNSNLIAGTNTPYSNVGQIRQDILRHAFGEYYICWDDDDFYMPYHISNGMKYILSTGKKAYKPMRSFWSPDGGTTIEYAQNSMEASIIVKLEEIKKFGFANSNGAEHLTWLDALKDSGELDENYDVYPFESYMYVWGEDIASHKQSGSITNPNCFEEHKAKSIDFGVRPLDIYSPLRMKLWYQKIVNWVNHPELTNKMKNWI